MTNEEKARALLGSPAGCSVILDMSENLHLGIKRLAEPSVSFWLASSAMDWCDVHAGEDWLERFDMTLDSAKDFADLALEIVSSPAFAWWYEPLDLDNQIWTSPQMIRGNLPSDPDLVEPFQPEVWRKPGPLIQTVNRFPTRHYRKPPRYGAVPRPKLPLLQSTRPTTFARFRWPRGTFGSIRMYASMKSTIPQTGMRSAWNSPIARLMASWYPTGKRYPNAGTECMSPSVGRFPASRRGTSWMADGR